MEPTTSEKPKELFFLLGLKALFSIGFGLAFIINPDGMINTLSFVLGAALILFGLVNVYNGLKVKKLHPYWVLLIEDGALQLIFGLILVFWPQLTPMIIMIMIGIWMILGGVIQLIIANKYGANSAERNIRGLLAVCVGAVILFNPDSGLRFFTLLLGSLSLLYGIYMVLLVVRWRKAN